MPRTVGRPRRRRKEESTSARKGYACSPRLAWHATATAALEGGDGRGSRIGPAVEQMLQRFSTAAR
jgi:hypothetical protein